MKSILRPVFLSALSSLFMSLFVSAVAAGTPAGTSITNVAYFDTLTSPDPTAQPVEVASQPVTVTVVHVPNGQTGPDSPGTPTSPVTPTDPTNAAQCGQTTIGVPGQNIVLSYTQTNTSNGPDTYDLSTNVASGTDASLVKYYLDDGSHTFKPTEQVITDITLNADQSATFYAVYPVPANATGNQGFALSPVTTSRSDKTVFDANNFGCIVTQKNYGVTLITDNTGTAESPSTVSYNHTLTNTGNTPLDATTLAATQTNTQNDWTTSVQLDNQAPQPNFQAALAAFGPIAPGQKVNVKVNLNVPAGVAGNTVNTLTWSIHATPTASSTVTNGSGSDVTVTDTTTVLQGISTVTKSVLSCGTDTTCASPVAVNANQVTPGQVLQYVITGSNTGQGGLRGSRLRDPLPAELTAQSYSATISGTTAGQLLYSLDGKSWSTTVPTVQGQTEPTVWVGYDANSDGSVDFNDVLPPNAVITVKVIARVK